MNNIIIFLLVCIKIRLLAVYLSYLNKYHKILGILYILFGLGILNIYIFNLRPTGVETGGKKIWWDKFRPVFATIWILFGISSLLNKPYAWKILSLDVILGLTIFLDKHFLHIM